MGTDRCLNLHLYAIMNIYHILVYLFTISEILLLILKRSGTSAKSKADQWSLTLFWLVIPLVLFFGDYFAEAGYGLPVAGEGLRYAGIGIFAVGFLVRWIAVFQLGNKFTVDVAITSGHTLKTNGLYKIVRHPSYFGLMLIITGVSFFMSNWLSSMVIIMPIFLATLYRIKVEETTLTAEFGQQYNNYKKRVKRLVPFVY